MAKQRSSGEHDPFDDPFDSDLEDIEIDASDLKLDDAGDLDDALLAAIDPPSTRPPLSIGDIFGGTIQVILIAALVIVLFLALGFGLIFGGQQLGVIPTRANSTLSLSNLLPTQDGQPTNIAQINATAAPALPTLTPDLTCSRANDWWNSQQISDNFDYFSVQAVNEARDASRLAALLEQMRIRRDFVANYPADPCLRAAHDALLRAFDATIETARVISTTDQAAIRQRQDAQTQAYAELTAELWAVNINLDANSPAAQGVARRDGAACGAQAWYDSVKPHEAAFYTAAQQIDLTTMPESAVRPLIDTMQAEIANAAQFAAPVCATPAQSLLIGALDSYVQALDQQIAARTALGDYSEYDRQNSLFRAWLVWLGVR